MPFTKENAKENAYKSHESWKKNGSKRRGGFSDPERARAAGLKGLETARKNRTAKKASIQDEI